MCQAWRWRSWVVRGVGTPSPWQSVRIGDIGLKAIKNELLQQLWGLGQSCSCGWDVAWVNSSLNPAVVLREPSWMYIPLNCELFSAVVANCSVGHLLFSHTCLFATPWPLAHQAPLSMRFPRREYCSGLPFPSSGDLPGLGIEPMSPPLQVLRSLLSHWGKS